MAASSAPPRDMAPADRPASIHRVSDAVVVMGVGAAFVAIVVLLAWASNGGNRATRPSLVAPAPSESMQQAGRWMAANLPRDSLVVIDAAAADDLIAQGVATGRVVEIAPVGSLSDGPSRWTASQYLVASPALRSRIEDLPDVRIAVDSWTPVAAFGSGADRVEVRRIASGLPGELHERDVAAQALRLRAGADLADNPRVTASPGAAVALRSGRVDVRLLSVLATFSVSHDLHIHAFPTVEGEESVGAPRRIVEIDRGSDSSPIEAFLEAQRQSYRPMSVTAGPAPSGDAVLRVTYPVAPVAGA